METTNIACPVCTLFLREGITLENHLTTHPKQKVIEALIKLSTSQQQTLVNNACTPSTSGMAIYPQVNSAVSEVPTNHSFIYQQFLSSSGTQPVLNVNGMNPQFVAIPTPLNTQIVTSPIIFQQQQQVQIVRSSSNFQPIISRSVNEFLPSNAIYSSSKLSNSNDNSTTKEESSNNEMVINEMERDAYKERVSVTITNVDKMNDEQDTPLKFECNKSSQTQLIEKESNCNFNFSDNVIEIIDDENKIYNENSDNDIEIINEGSKQIINTFKEKGDSNLSNNLENNVTVLAVNDMNFFLSNNFINSSKIDKTEPEEHKDIQKIVIINEPSQLTIHSPEKQTVIKLNENYLEENVDDEGLSRESLNIQTEEQMPPQGELSEQDSNSASDVYWETKLYQEGSSGVSTSYDLLAREQWEGSECSDSDISITENKIISKYEDDVTNIIQLNESSKGSNYNCFTCGEEFRCPKERRVHQANHHNDYNEIDAGDTNVNTIINNEPDVKYEDIFLSKSELCNLKTENKVAKIPDSIEEKVNILCNMCGEFLTSTKDLEIHNRKVHNIIVENPSLKCKTCKQIFPTRVKYTEHLKVHPLECTICGKNFYKFPNLKLHLKRHSGIRNYKCDTCSKAFFTKQKLQEHLYIHSGVFPIKCNLCNESFRRHSNLVQHRNHHHLKIRKKVRDYVCPCGEVFHSKKKFNWHKEIHDSKPKSCIYCHEKFIHMASLTRHIRRAHNKNYVPDQQRQHENVECDICKKVYLKTSLEAHLSTHTNKKQFSCSICSREFSTKWNLKLHKWTHASATTKPYKCEICQNAFIRETDYISHMNSHRSIKPYSCNYCGCKFIRKYNCLRHVREHEESKSYSCTVCNKSFHRSYYLTEHMRVHNGVRPFACHICGKTSTTKSNHNKHMKIHHAREPVVTEG